jgi:hypothetical protein
MKIPEGPLPAGHQLWGQECLRSGLVIRWFAGIQDFPNGNIFVCNTDGKVPFFEISRDKQIIWRSSSTVAMPPGHGI